MSYVNKLDFTWTNHPLRRSPSPSTPPSTVGTRTTSIHSSKSIDLGLVGSLLPSLRSEHLYCSLPPFIRPRDRTTRRTPLPGQSVRVGSGTLVERPPWQDRGRLSVIPKGSSPSRDGLGESPYTSSSCSLR